MAKVTYTPEQERIIDGTPADSDILIVAGAGSGKTFTMTQRILHLLEQGKDDEGRPIDPASILGLTFTKKAAGELDQRVRSAVEEFREGKEADAPGDASVDGAPHADRAPSADHVAARPHISTYDSFFQEIVRDYGLLIGIDPQTQPLSSAGAHELAARVAGQSLNELFLALLRPDPLLPGVPPQENRFVRIVDQILSMGSEVLSYMIDERRQTFDDALKDADRWNDELISVLGADLAAAQLKHPELYAQAVPAYFEDHRGVENSVHPLSAVTGKKLDDQKTLHTARDIGRTASLYYWARYRKIILTLVDRYQRLKREQGMAEFSDFTTYAFRLVMRFPSIGERYRRQYRFVFLDEYQDTSTTQARLIAQLFHPSAQVARKTDGPARSVTTAVGDPFQSIYGWRGASPSAFTLFQHDFGLGHAPDSLSMTHRNKDLVLEVANKLTEKLRDPDSLGRKTGDRAEAAPSVSVLPLKPMRLEGEGEPRQEDGATVTAVGFPYAEQEHKAVALWAKDEVRRLEGTRDPGEARRPLVAVLLRSKTHMDDYIAALEDEGLDVQVVGLDRVLDQPEVRDLLAVLGCVTDRTDVPSLMRLLATPRYGLDSADLRALSQAAEKLNRQKQYDALVAAGLATGKESDADRAALVRTHRDALPVFSTLIDLLMDSDEVPSELLSALTPSARAAVSSVATVLHRTESAQSQGLSATLEEACEALGLDTDVALARVIAHPQDAPVPLAVSRTNTEAVMGLVDTYLSELVDTSSATLRGFVSWIHSQQQQDLSPATVESTEADVAIMTIHQSKGLEWPAVAVAGMTSKSFPSQEAVRISQAGDVLRVVESFPWIETAGAVPVPMRSDASILPPFPSDLEPGEDPVEALQRLDSCARVSEEVYAPNKAELEQGEAGDDYPARLSLEEQYGKRAHAEERRLAYVAVTRSSGDVLLTYSGHNSGSIRADARYAGLFWNEVAGYLSEDPAAVMAGALEAPKKRRSRKRSLQGVPDEEADAMAAAAAKAGAAGAQPPIVDKQQICGYACGPSAQAQIDVFEREIPAVTQEMVSDSKDPLLNQLLWPASVPRKAMRVLAQSARIVSQHIADAKDSAHSTDPAVLADASGPQDPADPSVPTPLTDRARQLLRIEEEKQQQAHAFAGDQPLAARARAALQGKAVPTTTVQRLASAGQESDVGKLLLQIVRPMPQGPNESAGLGTLFHNWVAGRLDPLTEEPLQAGIPDREDVETGIRQLGEGVESRRFARWQKAFNESIWSRRRPIAVERPYDMALAGHRIPARLDAVFAGALDDEPGKEQAGRYTVVDWKTGRRPTTDEQIRQRLLQLDLYRIAFSRARQVPMDHVDACLFYVAAPAGKRQIAALASRSEEEILRTILGNPAAAAVLGTDFDEDDAEGDADDATSEADGKAPDGKAAGASETD